MGSMAMGTTASEQEAKFEDIYTLRFEFVDELGQPVKGIPYKTLPAGQKITGILPTIKPMVLAKQLSHPRKKARK